MYLYFNNEGILTTIIPHGQVPRQGSYLDLYICLSEDFFKTDNEREKTTVNVTLISPDGTTLGTVNAVPEESGLKLFEKNSDSEITYDLISGIEYWTYHFKFSPGNSTAKAGKIIANVVLNVMNDDGNDEYENIQYFGNAGIFIEKTFGNAQTIVNEANLHYKNLIAQINKLQSSIGRIEDSTDAISQINTNINETNKNVSNIKKFIGMEETSGEESEAEKIILYGFKTIPQGELSIDDSGWNDLTLGEGDNTETAKLLSVLKINKNGNSDPLSMSDRYLLLISYQNMMMASSMTNIGDKIYSINQEKIVYKGETIIFIINEEQSSYSVEDFNSLYNFEIIPAAEFNGSSLMVGEQTGSFTIKPSDSYNLSEFNKYFIQTSQKEIGGETSTTTSEDIPTQFKKVNDRVDLVEAYDSRITTNKNDIVLLKTDNEANKSSIEQLDEDIAEIQTIELEAKSIIDNLTASEYSATEKYKKPNIVYYEGNTYMCKSDIEITGVEPTNTANWQLICKGTYLTGMSKDDDGDLVFNYKDGTSYTVQIAVADIDTADNDDVPALALTTDDVGKLKNLMSDIINDETIKSTYDSQPCWKISNGLYVIVVEDKERYIQDTLIESFNGYEKILKSYNSIDNTVITYVKYKNQYATDDSSSSPRILYSTDSTKIQIIKILQLMRY